MGTDWVHRMIVGTDIAQYTLVWGSSFNSTSKRCYPIGRTTWRTRCICVFIRTPWHTIQVGTEIQGSTYSMRIHHLPEMQHLRNINLVQSPHQAKGTAPPHPEEFLPCGFLYRDYTWLHRGKKGNVISGRYALIGSWLVTKISQKWDSSEWGMEQRTIEKDLNCYWDRLKAMSYIGISDETLSM